MYKIETNLLLNEHGSSNLIPLEVALLLLVTAPTTAMACGVFLLCWQHVRF